MYRSDKATALGDSLGVNNISYELQGELTQGVVSDDLEYTFTSPQHCCRDADPAANMTNGWLMLHYGSASDMQ